ncbi:hypothetical protein [Anaerosporobacter sp.]|uniref:hypothetical protein n=1 Tax=Anaerosporobacter sp. TaxID=1872529 RepID=UPI00286ED224|nr:hypothetical protein [Anaerosporobacter sp.]
MSQSYKNNEIGIAIEYGECWGETILNQSEYVFALIMEDAFFQNLCNDETIGKPSINLMYYPNVRGINIRQIVYNTEKEIRKFLYQFNMKKRIVQDKESYMLYSGQCNGEEMVFVQKIYYLDNKVYSLTATCSAKLYDLVKEDINYVFSNSAILQQEV